MAHHSDVVIVRCRPSLRCRGACCLPVVVVAFVFLVIGPTSPAGAQETPRPWVLVAIPETPADEARNEILADVIADTVELTLKLVGDYVIQPRPDALAGPASPADAASLAEELSLDYVVFGRVEEIDDGSTRFSLSVYNREQDEVVLEREAVAQSLFETFSVADALSAELLGAFTGQRIAYGSIELVNEAPDPGEYRVLVDGEPVGSSPTVVERILIGPRRIEIVGVDGTRIESDTFIAEGHRTRLTFSVAELPEEDEPLEELTDEQEPEVPEVADAPQALPGEEAAAGIAADPPAPEPGASRDDKERVVTEPPLEWRVYPWSRSDPGRRDTPIWTSTFHLIREERPEWDSHGWGGGLTARMDWGRRHSLMIEYSRVKPNWEDPDDDGSASELHADDVTAETTLTYRPADLYRLATGYGVRLEPVAGLTVMPWWRVALERDGRRAMLQEETGEWTRVSFQRHEERAIFVPEVATGELFWNVVTGPALAVEGSLRRASLYAMGGISRTIPFTRRYSATVTVTPSDIEENREVPVTGTIDPSWGWYAGLGAGYSWGGDERTVNRAYFREVGQRRSYESYGPEDRAPWGLSVAPSFGAPVIFAPRSNRGTLAWLSPAFSIEYARPAGRLLEATVFAQPPVGRASRVLQEAEEGAEPITINSDVRTPVVGVRLAAGRRRELSQRFTMSLGYHISPVFQTMGGGFYSVGEAVRMAGLGPILSVARAPVGSSSIVFATVVLHTPMALGRTPYSAGLDDEPDGEGPADIAYQTSDGYTDRPPMVVASIGVRFRVAGTPARILAAPEGATERPGGRAAEGAPQDASPWWRPAVSLGLGTAVPIADDPSQGTRYSGVLTTVPVALHFPFGGELGLEASIPVGRRGISAPEAPYPIVDITNQYGTFQVPMDATPRLNRITSIEAGYRLRREQRLSLRPALRYTWADLELWAIEARLQDGTFLAPGEEHFTRVDPVHFLGVSVEAAWTLRPALTLRATAGASRRVSAAEATVTPAYAPTVEVVYPDSLVTLGVAVTVAM